MKDNNNGIGVEGLADMAMKIKIEREAENELQEYKQLKNDMESFKFKMLLQMVKKKGGGGRPTKADFEKKRISDLLAEGKGPDGQYLDHSKREPVNEIKEFRRRKMMKEKSLKNLRNQSKPSAKQLSQIAISIAVLSFLMSLYNLIW